MLLKIKRLLCFGYVATLCATSFPAFAENSEYDFVLTGRSNPYWTAMKSGIEDAAKAGHVNAVVYEAENERDAEGELNICQTAIQRKPKAIIMSSINPGIGIECFKQAQAAGIFVADIDGNLPVVDAAKAGIALTFSIGSDNTIIGEKAAEYLASMLGKPNPKVLILEGVAGSLNGNRRRDGFRNKLSALLPKAVVVASISAEFDRMKALNITTDILQRQPDLDVIYAANDEMALGAAEAVRNAGKTGGIKIIGVDGTHDAVEAVKSGKLTATVAQLPYLMGKRAVELISGTAQSGKAPYTETTPTPVLTKDVLQANQDPLLQYVR